MRLFPRKDMIRLADRIRQELRKNKDRGGAHSIDGGAMSPEEQAWWIGTNLVGFGYSPNILGAVWRGVPPSQIWEWGTTHPTSAPRTLQEWSDFEAWLRSHECDLEFPQALEVAV